MSASGNGEKMNTLKDSILHELECLFLSKLVLDMSLRPGRFVREFHV